MVHRSDGRPRHRSKVRSRGCKWSTEDNHVDVLALEHAQTAFEDVHDRIVQPLPVVDDLVVVDACDDISFSFLSPR